MTQPIPYRPRLADHAHLRRHLVDGEEVLLLIDSQAHEAHELSREQVDQLLLCDGTRDLGGILLAAVQRDLYSRASAVEQLLSELHQKGLLADGLTAPPRPRAALPVEELPGYRFRCNGNAACCTTFASVAFTAAERARAERLCPRDERMFLPLFGSDDRAGAVALHDGRCGYLAEDGRCAIHVAGGADAKPQGCRAFPAHFVADGVAVRVSVKFECPCVAESIGSEEGAPLVGEEPIPSWLGIAEVPPMLSLGTMPASRTGLRLWADAVADALVETDDAVAAAFALAEAVEAEGLGPEASCEAVRSTTPPEPATLTGWARLVTACREHHSSAEGWRSTADRGRRLRGWLAEAAAGAALADLLAPAPDAARDELFYLRNAVWGHQLVEDGAVSLADALRDRGYRMLLGRACSATPPGHDEPARDHPLTAVEAVMRGHGLARYCR